MGIPAWAAFGIEDEDPIRSLVEHIEPGLGPRRIRCQASWTGERPRSLHRLPESRFDIAAQAKLLDTLVAIVEDVHVADGIRGCGPRGVEAACICAGPTPYFEQLPRLEVVYQDLMESA